jgi:glutamate mutase epsilon subunit
MSLFSLTAGLAPYAYRRIGEKRQEALHRKKAKEMGLSYEDYKEELKIRTADPDDLQAEITKQDFQDYVKEYRGFEEDLLEKAQTDTSIVDQAREDAARTPALMEGVAERNRERYGMSFTPAQMKAVQSANRSGSLLGGIQAVNDGRIAQAESNQALMSDLINIGQDINRTSLTQLGNAAQDASRRKQAYEQAKSAHKSQVFSTVGGLGAAAIMSGLI